ncbi:MAG: aminodeoxychorismate synthase component I [bacterium]|nr:aminodeoxychorismate synthase component I [bacterium]
MLTLTLRDGPDPATVLPGFARRDQPAFLESLAGDPERGRWSVFAGDPVEVVSVPTVSDHDPFAAWQTRMEAYPAIENRVGLPFVGGWIGFISYEAGASLEKIQPSNPAGTSLPAMRMALYDHAAIFDHRTSHWHLVAVEWPDHCGIERRPAALRIAELRRVLDTCPPHHESESEVVVAADSPVPDWTQEEYLERVRIAKDYIAAGDVYQVNLTQRFTARTGLGPLQLYRDLRDSNPADYAAFLAWDGLAVLSSSPELFLDLRAGEVLTCPIKGTRPRTGDAPLDAIRRQELLDSEKDRAELNMIIDLLRNDLSRVCLPGSVRVVSAGELEAHPTVFHRVATIAGRLDSERSLLDLLRATCPGGSITGAPKIRAMQIIDELETVQRGVYCGAIGYVGLDGSMMMNIAIRTMIFDRGSVHIHAGGGIVADSDPLDEYEESLAKAAGMFRALRSRRGAHSPQCRL